MVEPRGQPAKPAPLLAAPVVSSRHADHRCILGEVTPAMRPAFYGGAAQPESRARKAQIADLSISGSHRWRVLQRTRSDMFRGSDSRRRFGPACVVRVVGEQDSVMALLRVRLTANRRGHRRGMAASANDVVWGGSPETGALPDFGYLATGTSCNASTMTNPLVLLLLMVITVSVLPCSSTVATVRKQCPDGRRRV